jgi:hypothetical protein
VMRGRESINTFPGYNVDCFVLANVIPQRVPENM